MNWQAYTQECLKTAFDLPPVDLASMCALGLAGELGEYLATPSVNELGDVTWYLAVLIHALGLDEWVFDGPVDLVAPPWRDVAAICEQVKKWKFHEKVPKDLSQNLRNIYYYCKTQPFEFEEVLSYNVEKLRERYLD